MPAGWPRFDLYVITGAGSAPPRTHADVARAALFGGADTVQLRDKTAAAQNLGFLVAEIQPIARKYGAALLVNDRVDVALTAGADGVHIGPEDLPARDARRLLPRPALLGISAGTLEEARKAVRAGADYIGVGPIFATATKPDAGAPLGLETLTRIVRAVAVPVVAVGGIQMENIDAVIRTGAAGAAVVSAITSAQDMAQAARALKNRIVQARGVREMRGPGDGAC